MSFRVHCLAALAGAVCASAASAQMLLNDADPNAPIPAPAGSVLDALGDPVEAVNLRPLTGDSNNRLLGVEHAFGYYWVTGSLSATMDDQYIYQFDEDWNLVERWPQVTGSPGTAFWGHRDGASDESTNRLYFGQENGELTTYEYDDSTGELTHVATTPIPGVGTIRALARNPNNGHFFSKDFGGSIYEFDETGTIHDIFPNSLSTYGMAWDTVNDTLWLHATGGLGTFGMFVVEVDPTTGVGTGREFYDAIAPPGVTAGIVGGLTIVGDSELFVALVQGTPDDYVAIYEGENFMGSTCYPDCDESGALDFFDFLCFQNEFATGETYADCDDSGTLDFFDFLCFQNEFAMGCP